MYTKVPTISTGAIDTCMSGQCQGIVHLRSKQRIRRYTSIGWTFWVLALVGAQ